jgi:hypothetical protein
LGDFQKIKGDIYKKGKNLRGEFYKLKPKNIPRNADRINLHSLS